MNTPHHSSVIETIQVNISGRVMTLRRNPRICAIKARVRAHYQLERERLEREHRGPGYTWRGWWYPRWLLLAITWAAVAVLFGALCVGLFTHPILGA